MAKKRKWKDRDKVKITHKKSAHKFQIGEVVTLISDELELLHYTYIAKSESGEVSLIMTDEADLITP
jgi:hypothetical protein